MYDMDAQRKQPVESNIELNLSPGPKESFDVYLSLHLGGQRVGEGIRKA